ncbi:redoxin domain-containing protein [Streptomyces sp. NPDC058335]|uniref:redoxin domain-containing protein n=1 Tax=Streptomyces sp. NPDC058335 TaxID=3346451 RepID=UPI003653BA60
MLVASNAHPTRRRWSKTSIRLKPGDPAPQFSLPTVAGTALSLATLGDRPVILYAFPTAMTPGCTTWACDFRDSLSTLDGADFDVVGISPDTPEALAEFAELDGLRFPLVSDAFGVVRTGRSAPAAAGRPGRWALLRPVPRRCA